MPAVCAAAAVTAAEMLVYSQMQLSRVQRVECVEC
jgi:hypothetical protein